MRSAPCEGVAAAGGFGSAPLASLPPRPQPPRPPPPGPPPCPAMHATVDPSGDSPTPLARAADGHATRGSPPLTETACSPPPLWKKKVCPSGLQNPPAPLWPSGYFVN